MAEEYILVEFNNGDIVTKKEAEERGSRIILIAQNREDLGGKVKVKTGNDCPFHHSPFLTDPSFDVGIKVGDVIDLVVADPYILRGVKIFAMGFLNKLERDVIPLDVDVMFSAFWGSTYNPHILVLQLPNGHKIWVFSVFTAPLETMKPYLVL